jgi:hypothetical protein
MVDVTRPKGEEPVKVLGRGGEGGTNIDGVRFSGTPDAVVTMRSLPEVEGLELIRDSTAATSGAGDKLRVTEDSEVSSGEVSDMGTMEPVLGQ